MWNDRSSTEIIRWWRWAADPWFGWNFFRFCHCRWWSSIFVGFDRFARNFSDFQIFIHPFKFDGKLFRNSLRLFSFDSLIFEFNRRRRIMLTLLISEPNFILFIISAATLIERSKCCSWTIRIVNNGRFQSTPIARALSNTFIFPIIIFLLHNRKFYYRITNLLVFCERKRPK